MMKLLSRPSVYDRGLTGTLKWYQLVVSSVCSSGRVVVPLQGNAWVCDGGAITHKGLSKWTSEEAVCRTFVYIATPGTLRVSVNMNPKGKSTIR